MPERFPELWARLRAAREEQSRQELEETEEYEDHSPRYPRRKAAWQRYRQMARGVVKELAQVCYVYDVDDDEVDDEDKWGEVRIEEWPEEEGGMDFGWAITERQSSESPLGEFREWWGLLLSVDLRFDKGDAPLGFVCRRYAYPVRILWWVIERPRTIHCGLEESDLVQALEALHPPETVDKYW